MGTDWQAVAGAYTDYYDIPQGVTVGAPQSGASINLGNQGSRLSMAAIRKIGTDNFLWTCHHVGLDGPDSSYGGGTVDRSAVQWFKLTVLEVGSGALIYGTPVGRIFDNQTYFGKNTPYWYYMPSLNVNGAGDMVIGFSGSRAAEHISALFSGRKTSGTLMPQPLVLAAGQLDAQTAGLWGDYSATTMDPIDGSFWSVQGYAVPNSDPVLGGGLWGTWVGQIRSWP